MESLQSLVETVNTVDSVSETVVVVAQISQLSNEDGDQVYTPEYPPVTDIVADDPLQIKILSVANNGRSGSTLILLMIMSESQPNEALMVSL